MNTSNKIKLSQGKFATVDDEDFQKVTEYNWWFDHGYARASTGGRKGKKFYLHRFILGSPKENIDHKDGNGLNCQKENLRLSTQGENLKNMEKHKDGSSKFKGAYYRKDRKKWQSRIMVNGKNVILGTFLTETQAAQAYDRASLKHHGEFGRRNFA